MQQGGGPDETRRFEGPGGGPDETRRLGGPGGPDATRRLGGPTGPDGPGGPDATRRMEGPGGPGDPGGAVLGGRYRLDGFLGAGGMADVHRATDLRLNRPVAVKIFRPGTEPDGEQRFHEEAQRLANLSHPGLVAVHDSGVESHRAYLVMELVDGPTLRQVLDQDRLPLGEVTRIGTDLADVLAYVHEQGVVHRDVKPSNVLLGRDGRVRLADFGISQLAGASGLTAADAALGTASYLAPEQVQGERVGPPADVYALGLVLLEAVTGHVEYPGGNWEAATARLSTPPAVPDNVPGPLRRALLAMTGTDPRRRPTAAQAAQLLAGAAVEDGAGDEPPRRSRAGRNVAIVIGGVALLAIIAAVALAGGDDEPVTAQPSPAPTATEEPAEGPAAEDPAAEDPAPQDPVGEDPVGEDPGADGGGNFPDFPSPPSFDPPDLPDLPDVPDVPESAREDANNAWERFKDWVSSWF